MEIFPRLLVAPPDDSAWQDPQAAARRLQGEVAHQALAFLEPGETDEAGIFRRLRQARTLLGVHPEQVDVQPLVAVIRRTLVHPLIASLFAADAWALPEQEIVIPGKSAAEPHSLVRVDRLVVLPDGSLWVLDFKLGLGDSAGDQAQVRNYQRLLANMFHRPCQGAIAYLETADVTVLNPQVPGTTDGSSQKKSPLPGLSAQDHNSENIPEPITPIRVFPLQADLIALLHDAILERTKPDHQLGMTDIQVIFPHRRPGIFLHQRLARSIGVPFLPPRCLSLEDWILRQACLASDDPPAPASLLDQAWLLHTIHQMPGFEHFAAGKEEDATWHRFLPWGVRLAKVLDELDRELVTAENVSHPPDDLPSLAADLLANLGDVQTQFHAGLAERNLTTSANLASQIDLDACETSGPTYLCGLFALTRSEAALIQALRQNGAQLWWQTDRPLPEPLQRWAGEWRAELEWVFQDDAVPDLGTKSTRASMPKPPAFILAHDLHSELRHLADEAATWNAEEHVAVILPDPAQLRPLLAHLPSNKNVNITLGLPLERTALGTLLHTLVRISRDRQLTGVGPGSRDYLDLWQNPWVRGILPEGALGLVRQAVRNRVKPYLDTDDMAFVLRQCSIQAEVMGETTAVDLCKLFQEAMNLSSLRELGGYLQRLLTLLHAHDKAPSSREMPLEMHVVHALHMRILPTLDLALSRDQLLPAAALWSVFWNILSLERVPFSGEPVTPWQVMGLLESRLMCFDRVVILECVEGVLPRAGAPNPLLPEALRPALGLPPGHADEQIIRYHLRRLMASAGEVRIYSRQGMSPNLLEGKTIPSRYWEQELWNLEKEHKCLLQNTIQRVPLDLDLQRVTAALPEKSSFLSRLHQRLNKGLSLSALNIYLSCPLRFFKEQVANFPPRHDPRQDPAAMIMGDAAHRILEQLLRPYCNSRVTPRNLIPDFEIIWDEVMPELLRDVPLSPAARFFQVRLLRELLLNYLNKSDRAVHLLAIEEAVERHLPGQAAMIRLNGRLDRVDQDEATALPLILDYKTGSAPQKSPHKIQRLIALAEELELLPPDQESTSQAGLIRIKEEMQSIQLPGYLYLYNRPATCGYLYIGEWNSRNIFAPFNQQGKKNVVEQNLQIFLHWQETSLPGILEWLGRHILEAPFFHPACQPLSCAYCPWRTTCLWAMEE
ncbi:PD-(D/E)XK nuclease superfamily protein [Desulfonatronum thiosulfatophilum]|uniref:PD-(D/E)XK nuclease superfamily protein n=1 Tax=Desulfonatronum thiosulfatophilum TaxID=617002 RepID=A0A1G6EWP9_9BACT|nr:PD-(D/E)XK nuclease family protein [Desulfonatronum thiosulfatophilum]SDB61884.1 PD-(D/E)XK nuclease superfamily protein [Desulfonatronum thiosulfatophilum]